MKHTVRSFSVGLLAAGLIMLVVFYFLDESQGEEQNHKTEEVIAQIEQEGYRVITEKEYISMSVADAQKDNEAESKEATDEEEESPVEEDATSADDEEKPAEEQEETVEEEEENTPAIQTITIESGMASSHISSMLADKNLIDDAEAFNSYLLENDYSLQVQMGDHELRKGMSFYEIAEALTN